MENINMTPSEKLNMLLDGETAGIDTSEVFYELSNNPELQQEFLDILKMRQLMAETPMAPPDRLKRGIMAGVGLGGSGLWYYLQNSGMVAATSSFVTSKVGTALIAGMIGVFATFMFMNNNDKPQINNAAISQSNANSLTSLAPTEMELPIVSSTEVTSNSTTKQRPKSASNSVVANEIEDEPIANSQKQIFTITPSTPELQASLDNALSNTASEELAFYELQTSSHSNSDRAGFIIRPSNRIVQDINYDRLMLFSLQAKGISNSSLSQADKSTTEAPAINDLGIALLYSVNDDFALGLEFGQEFFVRKVTSDGVNNSTALMENQLTFWGGLKASYTFNDMQIIDNLRPTTTLLLGGTNRGWVSKASAGLVYDISNKLSFYGGPEWTTGFYKFDSSILSTHKWGFFYGVALKF